MTTKPIQPTLPFNPEEIKPSTVKPKAVDGLGLSMKDYYWDVSTQQFERRDNPPEHISSSDQKVGSPLHRKKYPERYGYHYTSKLEQAAFPIPGTCSGPGISKARSSNSLSGNADFAHDTRDSA